MAAPAGPPAFATIAVTTNTVQLLAASAANVAPRKQVSIWATTGGSFNIVSSTTKATSTEGVVVPAVTAGNTPLRLNLPSPSAAIYAATTSAGATVNVGVAAI